MCRSNNGSNFVSKRLCNPKRQQTINSGQNPTLVFPLAQNAHLGRTRQDNVGPCNALTDQTEKCNYKMDGPQLPQLKLPNRNALV